MVPGILGGSGYAVKIVNSSGSVFLYFLWKFSPELPSYAELKNYNPSLTSRVFTSDGLLLDKYYVQERIFVPIDRIPDTLAKAFISAEDKKFYSHFGIDPLAILRASIMNLYYLKINLRRLFITYIKYLID